MKRCSKCSRDQPLSEFYTDKRTGGRRPICKACAALQTNLWRKQNRERALEIQRNSALRRRLRQRGLDPVAYDNLLKRSGNACEICGGGPCGAKSMLSVDHCHETNHTRGLLCDPCNLGLGYFKHNPDLLRAAIDYLAMSSPPCEPGVWDDTKGVEMSECFSNVCSSN